MVARPGAAPHGGESILELLSGLPRLAAETKPSPAIDRGDTSGRHPRSNRLRNQATPLSFRRIDIAPLSITRLSGTDGRWNLTSSGQIGII